MWNIQGTDRKQIQGFNTTLAHSQIQQITFVIHEVTCQMGTFSPNMMLINHPDTRETEVTTNNSLWRAFLTGSQQDTVIVCLCLDYIFFVLELIGLRFMVNISKFKGKQRLEITKAVRLPKF